MKRTLYFTMILHPLNGCIRVGNAYDSRAGAKCWLPFISSAWRGCRAKVSQFTIIWSKGEMTERSVKILSEKFNMDVPASKIKPPTKETHSHEAP